jgi:hypothetical protein
MFQLSSPLSETQLPGAQKTEYDGCCELGVFVHFYDLFSENDDKMDVFLVKILKCYSIFYKRDVQFDRPSSFNELRKNWKNSEHLYDIPKD